MRNNFVFIFIAFLLIVKDASAGGAAAATKNRGQVQAQQQRMMQQQIQERMIQERLQHQQIQGHLKVIPREQDINVEFDVPVEQVAEVVEIGRVWESMAQNSRAWDLMIDQVAKEATVMHYIQGLAQKGVIIQNPPAFYVENINGLAAQNPELLEQPFENVLTMVAIMEYDLNNGQDKDALARKMLGEKGYMANKKRLGLTK